MTTDPLIEAALEERDQSISVGGLYARQNQKHAGNPTWFEQFNIEPALRDKFRAACARQGKDENAVLENLIGDWISTQPQAPQPATSFSG